MRWMAPLFALMLMAGMSLPAAGNAATTFEEDGEIYVQECAGCYYADGATYMLLGVGVSALLPEGAGWEKIENAVDEDSNAFRLHIAGSTARTPVEMQISFYTSRGSHVATFATSGDEVGCLPDRAEYAVVTMTAGAFGAWEYTERVHNGQCS